MQLETEMKRFTILSILSVPVACDEIIGEQYEVDWAPVNVWIKVQDGSGADLLDPENPDNLIDGTTISFKGETFEASMEWYEDSKAEEKKTSSTVTTKAYLSRMYGLMLVKDSMLQSDAGNDCSLVFGEIDAAADMDEDLVVTLSDGTSGTIHYHCSNHHEGRNSSCKRTWKFNGKEVDGNPFVFTISK